MARPSGRSRLPWYLGAIVLAAAAAYALYPVGGVVEGMGVVEPVFEDLVLMRPDRSGIVTPRARAPPPGGRAGHTALEYLGDGQWSVLAHGSMSGPGAVDQAPAEPEWTRAITQRRLARAEALRHWSARVFAHGGEPRMWERLFEQRLNVRVSQEDELALSEARAAENARLGLRSPPSRDDLGKLVRITLTAPARPRLWLWLDRG